MNVCDRLRELIDSRGLTHSEVARRAGMKQPNLVRLLSGRSANPTTATLSRILDAIGATPAELYREPEQ